MPAPLAKGLIISLSLLLAAGVAVYENPLVRQWVDESRRKMAMAFHSLGDDISPSSEDSIREKREDASTREDESPEAVERRRQARQEILERGRRLEERRRAKQAAGGRALSFDDMVDKDGALKPQGSKESNKTSTAQTTATETQAEDLDLRHRVTEAKAAAFGSTMANPFADEMNMEMDPSSSLQRVTSPPLPPKPAAYQPKRLAQVSPISNANLSISTPNIAYNNATVAESETLSNHPSEQLLDLTPTTSAPGTPPLSSPRSTSTAPAIPADLIDLSPSTTSPSQSTYHSINEWAMNQSARLQPIPNHQTPPQHHPSPFYSPPQSTISTPHTPQPSPPELERAMSEMLALSESDAGTGEHASQISSQASSAGEHYGIMSDGFSNDDDDNEAASEPSGIRTPGTWTEVGSQVSEEF